MLMRKYRLQWLGAGLLLLALLFVWKNATSLVPRFHEPAGETYVAGQEAGAGFVNLLRRNIPPRDLLKVCFEEWTRSLTLGHNYTIARVDRAQSAMEAEDARPPGERNQVKAYREICESLNIKRRNRGA
jgi:hypothetical protein